MSVALPAAPPGAHAGRAEDRLDPQVPERASRRLYPARYGT